MLALYLLMNYSRLLAAVGTVTCCDLSEQCKLPVETAPSTKKNYSVPPPKTFLFLLFNVALLKVRAGDDEIVIISEFVRVSSVMKYTMTIKILTNAFIVLCVSIVGEAVLKILSCMNGASKLMYLMTTA